MIADNLKEINDKIRAAALAAGRSPNDIKLVAVSKKFPVECIQEAFEEGQILFGENYIQEISDKWVAFPKKASLHFIGHLQSNKAKIAAEICSMVETVDNAKLARELDKQLLKLNRRLDILIQVNIGDDANKSGISVSEAQNLIKAILPLRTLRVCGLMTIPPISETPEESREYFRQLKNLANELANQGLFPEVERPEISMGMSDDFTIAIQEGATIIRIGTAIFGRRT